ncbi:MAG: ATP-dependent DNA helicase RecG [Bacilli bacterium]|nr:ATP-dependent DNA helicase RecG [Bacilli bacterium]
MDLEHIKGIGEKTIEHLYESGIYNLEDLLTFYPYRYQILNPTSLEEKSENETITINATIVDVGKVSFIKKNFNVLRFKAESYGKIINVSIFNRAYLKRNMSVGREITLTGKYNSQKNSFTASDMKLSKLESEKIIPIYHNIKGIKNASLNTILENALKEETIEDFIPKMFQQKYKLSSKQEALRGIHQPLKIEELEKSRKRIIYEELFEFMFKINYLKILKESDKGIEKNIPMEKIQHFIAHLPFELTKDQKESITIGLKELSSPKKMNRLLLGDVGSGKTIVATILSYANYLAGYQTAFLAPTEILAVQHFKTCRDLFKNTDIAVEILIGSMTKKEKINIMKRMEKGEIDLLIGTHAILNEQMHFQNLGFIITDEQHRFGVSQREFLGKKGEKPDMLFMSATPIPRTYALTIYGDMDTSQIKQKPQGRKEIITKLVKEEDLKMVLLKTLEEIKAGHQIYVVAPTIEENEENDLKNVYLLKEKFDLAYHSKVPIGILHGKLKKAEKENVMNDFKLGKTKILISTTVVEVGVDVKNATVMIIFDSERFGLATLHQLRGRVGRNNMQSYCYLICKEEKERLKVLEESNDGFYISEKDFEFRGEGDLFGERQSGDMTFKMANLKRDFKALLVAKKDSEEYIKSQEYLKDVNYQKICQEIDFTN